jgi:hypothetical protein
LLTVTVDQSSYGRTLSGTGSVQVHAIPVAPVGTAGRLIARNDSTGGTAEFTWEWRALRGSTSANPQRSLGKWSWAANLVKTMWPGRETGRPSPSVKPFDGEWRWNSSRPFAIRIAGTQGVATLSNAPGVYAIGDTILHIETIDDKSFSGRILYTDGIYRQITAVLTAVDRLDVTAPPGQSGRYDQQFVLIRQS